MKIFATTLTVTCIIALGGCSMPQYTQPHYTQPRILPIKSTFDPGEVSFIKQDGDNTIRGQAFMRQRGGGTVTCAGESVVLIPSGRYSRERIKSLYGGTDRPRLSLFSSPVMLPKPLKGYGAMMRFTTCDANGKFMFANVANGSYFITTMVSWFAGPDAQGGELMAPVKLNGKEEKQIIMAF